MPVTDWYETTDAAGKTWLWAHLMQVGICIDDPDAGMFLAVSKPIGGVAAWPALAKGDPGFAPTFAAPVMHALEPTDSTPDNVTRTLVTPGTATTPPVYRDDFWLHKGSQGVPGNTVIDLSDISGTPLYKRIPQVNAGVTGFEYAPQLAGPQFWPTAVTEAPALSSSSADLWTCAVAAQPFAWRPIVSGMTVISSGIPGDAKVDLVARLGGSGGPAIGRCPGIGGMTDRLILPTGPDTNASTGAIQVAANTAATIVFRTEKQGGIATYQTGVVAPSRFWLKVDPIP